MRIPILLFGVFSLVLIASLVLGQGTTIIGTCDQYQAGIGGDFCGNTGSATGFFRFSGDVVNQRGGPFCNATNTSQCGMLTVIGIEGIPINGTPADGQTLCYHAANNTWIPCAP
jgi:hypothetical protein